MKNKVLYTSNMPDKAHAMPPCLSSSNILLEASDADNAEILLQNKAYDFLIIGLFRMQLNNSSSTKELQAIANHSVYNKYARILFLCDSEESEAFVIDCGYSFEFCFPMSAPSASLSEKLSTLSTKAIATCKTLHNGYDMVVPQIMRAIGVTTCRGSKYLFTAVHLVYNRPELIFSISRELYPQIADMYGIAATKVERYIREAIDYSFNNGLFFNINSICGCSYKASNEVRPTNGEVIAIISDYAHLQTSSSSNDGKMIDFYYYMSNN